MAVDQNGNPIGSDAQASQVTQPAAQPQAQAPAAPAQELPVEARDRTKEQFDKLLDSNRRLFEANENLRKEIETRGNSNKMFEPIQQAQAPAQAVRQQINPEDFIDVDPVTGDRYINDSRLKKRMEEIQQRASRAEETIQNYIQTSEQREVERQNKEAFSSYPELNPTGEKFDVQFNKQVRGVLFDSMYNIDDYGGKPLSFKEAADFVRSQYSQAQAPSQPKEGEQAPAEGGQDAKQQAAAQAQSQPQQARQSVADTEEMVQLKQATRMGDLDALTRRLMNIPHTRSDAEAS